MVAVLAESKTGDVDVEMEQAQCHHFPAGLRPTEHVMSREGVHSAWARCACGKCATACSLSSGPHVTRTWSNTVCRWMPHRYSSPLPPTIRQHVATFRSTMPRISCKSPAPVAMRRRGHVYPCSLVAADTLTHEEPASASRGFRSRQAVCIVMAIWSVGIPPDRSTS
jgi:hypothetical protein